MGGANSSNQSGSQQELNAFQKIIGVFFSPTKTFESIDRKPGWIVPVVVILLITVVISIVANPILLPLRKDKIIERMEQRGATRQQMDNMLDRIDKSANLGFIFATIRLIIKLLILTLIVWFVGKFVLGKDASFEKVFSVFTYSYLPWVLGMVLVVILMVVQKSPDIHFSIATFLPGDQSGKFIYNLVRSIGVFSIWHFIVLALGLSVIYKLPPGKNIGSSIVLFLIYIPLWAILSLFLN